MKHLRRNAVLWISCFAVAASLSIGALKSKPTPDFPEDGVLLDVSGWSFRKPVEVVHSGAQQLELDLDVLSHARRGLEDLRVLRNGKQVPYILERTSISREIAPEVTLTNDSHLSRWTIKLPRARLPVSRLVCEHSGTVFQRDVALYEEIPGERGEKLWAILNTDTWIQTPSHNEKQFTLRINNVPKSDTLYLQTDNGDNPPIEFEKFMVFYPVTRLLFEAKADDSLLLYYGEPYVNAPHYDLGLMTNELLAADKAAASLGAEAVLKESWTAREMSGKGGAVFWGILALVVITLLVVIARLLPKSESQPPK